jgi:hypothetical protein
MHNKELYIVFEIWLCHLFKVDVSVVTSSKRSHFCKIRLSKTTSANVLNDLLDVPFSIENCYIANILFFRVFSK